MTHPHPSRTQPSPSVLTLSALNIFESDHRGLRSRVADSRSSVRFVMWLSVDSRSLLSICAHARESRHTHTLHTQVVSSNRGQALGRGAAAVGAGARREPVEARATLPSMPLCSVPIAAIPPVEAMSDDAIHSHEQASRRAEAASTGIPCVCGSLYMCMYM